MDSTNAPHDNAVYLNLKDGPITNCEEAADSIVDDYDNGGYIVGIEILDASNRADDPEALKQFSFQLPTAG